MDALTRAALDAGAGDERALANFVRLSQPDVWRLCAHLVGRDHADDVTQDVFLRAVPSLARFRADSSARTWLLSITRRCCADYIRSAQRTRRIARVATQVVTTTVPDHAGQHALDALIDALSPERRDAFVLTQVLGLSYAEAAEVCGCEIGTIRSRVSRARAELVASAGGPAAVDHDRGADDERAGQNGDAKRREETTG